MTVEDYYALDLLRSPFVFGGEPSLAEIASFLRILSKESQLWERKRGWRKAFPSIRPLWVWWHGFRVKRKFGHTVKMTPDGLSVAAISEPFVIAALEYVKKMFRDAPKGKTGRPSPVCFPCAWMDAMQSEYGMTTAEVWAMPLPQLFQRLVAIRLRRNPEDPGSVAAEGEMGRKVLVAMKSGVKKEDLATLFPN